MRGTQSGPCDVGAAFLREIRAVPLMALSDCSPQVPVDLPLASRRTRRTPRRLAAPSSASLASSPRRLLRRWQLRRQVVVVVA